MATIKLSHALALAQSHLLAGRLAETEAVCRAVLAVEPEDAEAHRLLGLVAYYRLDFQGAVSLLERAAELRPDWAVCSDNCTRSRASETF